MRTRGINHLALVCNDMAQTVKFYTEVLEMPPVKTIALTDGGQHHGAGDGLGVGIAAPAATCWPSSGGPTPRPRRRA